MFNFFNKSNNPKIATGQTVKLKLSGMHCSSCAVNIDLVLEDVEGVYDSKTHFARSFTQISFDPNKTNIDALIREIAKLGYDSTVQK